MIGTFATELEHFAHSVDIVDDAKFDRVRELIYQYIGREFKDVYFELLREHVTSDGKREVSLRTFWSSTDEDHLWKIHESDNSYVNAVTAVFDTGKPLWLVSQVGASPQLANSQPDGGSLHDEWSLGRFMENLPRYNPSSEGAQTAIVMPLPRKRVPGVVCIESTKQTRRTHVASAELTRLCNAISILFELYDVNLTQSKDTGTAIADLSSLVSRAKFPKTALPHAFVASPKKADPQVMSAIKGVLDEFSERVEATDWNRISQSGSIPAQIAQEIDESVLGICYLSEPVRFTDEATGKTYPYRDNANVIFEAGMLHNRTSSSSDDTDGQPRGWIPIREEEGRTPPPPFDFAAERILFVPRKKTSGELLLDTFKDALRERLNRLLGS